MNIQLELPDGFLKEEDRNGYIVSEKMKRIWAIEIDLVMQLDRVCKKYGLKYFMDGGTLLGSVREKGFIPWDDDIDVVMKRDDYERFLKVGQGEFNHPYFLQTAFTDKEYLRGHAQLRNSESTAITPIELDAVSFNQGIFIDIFPLDWFSENETINKIRSRGIRTLRKTLVPAYFHKADGNQLRRKLKALYAKSIHAIGFRRLYRLYESFAKYHGKKSQEMGLLFFYEDLKTCPRMPAWCYEETIDLPFEFVKLPAPIGYDRILKAYYGDGYMTPVKEPSYHDGTIYEPDIPYTEFLRKRSHAADK